LVSTGGATAWGGSQVRMAFVDFTRQLTLTADGSVWTCGSGEDGLLGNSNLLDLGVPTCINPTAFGHATMVFVTGNNRHSFAVTTEGILYSWGRDGVGVTAAAGPPPRATPMPVAASLAPGVRVGRSCRLPRLHTSPSAWAHTPAWARARRTAQRPRNCSTPCRAAPFTSTGTYAHVGEGQLRLLAVRERQT